MSRSISVLIFSFVISALMSSLSSAANQKVPLTKPRTSREIFIYPDYYIHEKSATAGKINLLAFQHVQQKFPLPVKKYDRQKHFGGWINRSGDNSCLDTRGLVLVRDSVKQTQVSSTCKVESGQWHDPYTDTDVKSAAAIQIDHLVPLKNAYMTGAYDWDFNKRCLYANYLGDQFHLLSVSGHENMSKSDRAPDEYMPPNKKIACSYLKIWLETKLIWNLRLTPNEVTGILKINQDAGCSAKTFLIDENEYQDQLTYINDNKNLCVGAKFFGS
jgi:hypothetical protein